MREQVKLLTPRQLKIAALVAKGLKNRDIGRQIGATENTIKNYMRVIFDKTGMNSRLELALWYVYQETGE